MNKFLLIALLLGTFPALAAPPIESESLMPVKAKPAAKSEKTRDVLPEEKPVTPEEQAQMLCETTNVMGSTAGPEYQAGVDAYGHAVVPAEGAGAGQQFTVPDRIDIPLNISVLQTVGVITAPTPDLGTNIGTISVLKGGQVLYNGKEMTTTVQGWCSAHLNQKTP